MPKILKQNEVAGLLKMSLADLDQLRHTGQLPGYHVDDRIVYIREEVRAFRKSLVMA
jgi:hypothetical protein